MGVTVHKIQGSVGYNTVVVRYVFDTGAGQLVTRNVGNISVFESQCLK